MVETDQDRATDQVINIIGHEGAEQKFLDAYNSGRLHHAWLITGSRGIGKATLARKMARFLLHNPPAMNDDGPGLFGDALEKAPATSLDTDVLSRVNMLISADSHGDLFTLKRRPDEKSGKMRAEIAIDDVRKLIGFFSKTSTEGGWRIAIVDSADEMNRASANALLKILEEPPKNTIFFLLAHAPGKLLPTVVSRCRQLGLKPLSLPTVREILTGHYPDMAADDINGYALLSDGSPGYAIKLVEHEGLDLYIRILELLATMPRLDVPLAHKLADNLSRKGGDEKYILFGELLTSFISRMIRHAAFRGQHAEPAESPVLPVLTGELDLMIRLGRRISLDQWVDLWEKVSRKMGQINLDRKQVVLNILTLLNQKLN